MTIAIGGHATAKTSASALVCGPTPTVTTTGGAGTCYYIGCGWVNGNTTAPTLSDSKVNTYAAPAGSGVVTTMASVVHCCVFKIEAGTGGTLHTWTLTFSAAGGGTPDAITIFPVEVTGCVASGIEDLFPAVKDDTHSVATPFVSNVTGTTAQANEMLLSFIFTLTASGTETLTHGNSFTQLDQQANANTDVTGASSFRAVTAVGSYNSSVTSGGGAGTTEALSYIVSLKDATAGGAGSDPGDSPGIRQLKRNANYRMSPRSEHDARQFLRAQKRAYGFAA